ncbi:MAG: biotin/lipoyl-containing protein, partial [Saprospiraceae bacterium]|nr:biotin/lipoyl-containing protein [Saprospiraceae bacterium]
LNNPQNLENSFKFAREGGMIAQGALCITHSPVHTVDYYVDLAGKYIELGAEEICIKDMAGIGRPVSIGKIVEGIKANHPEVLVQYHGHSTPGFSVASSLEAAKNGADIIDVGMEPLSWGTGHADLLTIHAMLKDAGFSLPEVNTKAYMQVRSLSQEFIDDFLGYFINPRNRFMNSLLIGPGLPGGMMGSLMADLEKNLESVNKWLEKRDKPPISQEDLLLKLFEEVEYAWPRLGYPPLVTPYSQYVKNVSLMNAISLIKGKDRWRMIDENTWSMILGRAGQLPGELGEEIVQLAEEQEKDFFKGNPQDLYPDQLDEFRTKMKEKDWPLGPDDEELMEYAMHPAQYEDFKSGQARERFLEELEKKKEEGSGLVKTPPAPTTEKIQPSAPRQMQIKVEGNTYRVEVSYGENGEGPSEGTDEKQSEGNRPTGKSGQNGSLHAITAPLEGKFYLTKESSETAIQVGDEVEEGETVAYIESMKVINAITADKSGEVVEILARHGDEVEEDDPIIRLR